MVRTTINILLALAAIALLGALVVLSTSSNDSQRRLDQSLRHLRDIAQAMDRELINMRNLNIDGRSQLQALSEGMDTTLTQARRDIETGFPASPGAADQLRGQLIDLFNSVGGEEGGRADPARIGREFQTLARQGGQVSSQALEYAEQHVSFRRQHEAVSQMSREFVRELRERRMDEAADTVFRSSQQVLQRIERGGEADLLQVEAIVARFGDVVDLRSLDDQNRLEELGEALAALAPMRRQLDQSFEGLGVSQFVRQSESVRDMIGRDYLFMLSTVNDSRVLLNLYTVLLLLVLGYFGFRLQRSYGQLNDSALQLATMNASLEERVRERTEDLEEAYNELKESQVQLVQAEKMSSLGQLVAGVMHEINTPLLYVLNNQTTTAENVQDLKVVIDHALRVVEVLKTPGATTQDLKAELQRLRDGVDPAGAQEIIDEIEALTTDSQDGLYQISELVQSLKDFSRLDRAGEDAFDVRDGIEKTLTITHNLWKYGIDVVKDFEEIPEILCAPSKINQVFINLVTNAVQAMDGKGTLTLRTRHVDNWVQVEIEDTGCGIPEENLNKIMDPFFTTKPVGQGTGLGMSIVSKIIDDHGGHIDVQSEVGVGTKFIVRLPVSREATAEAA
jgi:signal transduction histidine kinase